MKIWWLAFPVLVGMAGCSSPGKPAKPTVQASAHSEDKNPYAKYIELSGIRVLEKSPGHLEVRFAVVNHSEADLGEVKLNVNLRTTAANPGDPPLVSFEATIPSLGASELKMMTIDVPTKLRVYELPDWQFVKADFQIIEPR